MWKKPAIQGVENRLRSRFGMTPKEAIAKLALCKRANKTSLQQHADDVSSLVQRGYAELDQRTEEKPSCEGFYQLPRKSCVTKAPSGHQPP